MDQILHGLLVPWADTLVPLCSLAGPAPGTMAAAAVSSSFSSQEQRSLPLRTNLDRNPFDPPPSAQIHDNTSGLFDLQDIADFDLEHPFQGCGAAGPKLVPLPKKAKCENIAKLQLRADRLQIRPDYKCDEVLPQNFSAKLLFNGNTFEAVGLFPSKDQARDAAAKLALESLPPLETKQAAGIKRKGDDRSSSPLNKSENWIGILQKNHAQKKRFEPDYDEYQVDACPPTFVCKLRLNGGPIELFEAGAFARKQDAKAASAKLAVEWLRSKGHLEAPVKRLKLNEARDGHTGLTQAVRNVDIDMEMDTKPQSFRQRVYELAAALGFQQPMCDPKPCSVNGVSGGSFWDAASIFKAVDVAREPTLAGPIGRVERVFGKNKAKEACSERVLPVLEAIKQRRLAADQGKV